MSSSWWYRWRPPGKDVLIAACFTAVAQLVTWGRLDEPSNFHGPRWLNAVLSAAVTGALAWRRRAPLGTVCWAVAVFCLSDLLVRHDVAALSSFLPLIVLTASAGYHCSRRNSFVAAGVAAVGLTTVVLVDPELRSVANIGYDLVFLLAPWLAMRGLRERENRAAALGADLERERATQDAARREVVATERVRIARELHDVVAHSVSVMVIQLGAARMNLPAGPAAAEPPLLAAEDVGRQALAELRRLLGVLRADDKRSGEEYAAPDLPQPGLSQLDTLASNARGTGLDVVLETSGEPVILPPGLDLTAYRIIQEAVTNALKHSSAHRIDIRIRFEKGRLDIEVCNDGDAAEKLDVHSGHGLVGIRERVALFGGTASAGPRSGGGWLVHAVLPLDATSPAKQLVR